MLKFCSIPLQCIGKKILVLRGFYFVFCSIIGSCNLENILVLSSSTTKKNSGYAPDTYNCAPIV